MGHTKHHLYTVAPLLKATRYSIQYVQSLLNNKAHKNKQLSLESYTPYKTIVPARNFLFGSTLLVSLDDCSPFRNLSL
jgi:hypothetical protein